MARLVGSWFFPAWLEKEGTPKRKIRSHSRGLPQKKTRARLFKADSNAPFVQVGVSAVEGTLGWS